MSTQVIDNILSQHVQNPQDARYVAAMSKFLSYVPHPVQMHFHQSEAKIRAFFGGNRSGKTTAGIMECLWWALGTHPFLETPPPPVRIRICAEDFQNYLKGVIMPKVEEWVPPQTIKKYWAEDRQYEFKNGSVIELKSYEQPTIKFGGSEQHLILMDEEGPYEVYVENLMRLISTRGKLVMTLTPIKGMTWIIDKIYDSDEIDKHTGANRVAVYIAETYDNPNLEVEEIREIEELVDEDSAEVRLHGLPIPKGVLVYPTFSHRVHVLRTSTLRKIPLDWSIYVGIDPHPRNPSGVVFLAVDPDGNCIVFNEIYKKMGLPDLVAKIKKILGKRKPVAYVIDTSAKAPEIISGRSLFEELRDKYGIFCVTANKDKEQGIDRVNEYFRYKAASDGTIIRQPRLCILDCCSNLLRELRHYIWDDYRQKESRNLKEQPIKKDDHLLDALRYIIMMEPRCLNTRAWREMRPKHLPDPSRIKEALRRRHG